MAAEEGGWVSVVWALVVTESAAGAAEGAVVVAFASPREADEFARRHGLGARVVPMHFAVELDRERMVAVLAAGRGSR